MPETKRMIPVDRFLAFMTADMEGDTKEADRLAQEMIDIDGVPQSFMTDRIIRRAKRQQD